jgi:hypothetical protein
MIKRTGSSLIQAFSHEREKKEPEIGYSLGDGRIRFAITAGACLFALVIVLKNILHVPESRFLPDIVVYIGIYTGFSLLYPVAIHGHHSQKINNPALWSTLVVVLTLAIIVLYVP